MSQPSETSFHLFTSLRYDPLLLRSPSNSSPTLNFTTPSPFYMLVYHRDRMLEAAQHFDFHAVASYLSDGAKLHQTLLDRVWDPSQKTRTTPTSSPPMPNTPQPTALAPPTGRPMGRG